MCMDRFVRGLPPVRSACVSEAEVDDTYYWYPFDITDLVQRWVDDPDSNNGAILVGSGNVGVQYELISNERRSVILRPKLVVDLVQGTPTPTPAYTSTPTPRPTFTPTNTVLPTPTTLPATGEHTFQQGQEGYLGVVDTQISSWDPDGNYSDSGKIVVRQGGVIDSLIRFDVSSLPEGVLVEKAILGVHVLERSNTGSMQAQV